MRSQTRGVRTLAVALVVTGVWLAAPAIGKIAPKAKFAKNAGLLDGKDSTSFASSSHAHGGGDITSGTVAAARIQDGAGSGLDADTLDGLGTSTTGPAGNVIYVSDGTGHLPSDSVGPASIVDTIRSITVPVHELDETFTIGTFPQKTVIGSPTPAPALAFDAIADETISFSVQLPTESFGLGNVALRWVWSTAGTSGDVRWEYAARAVAGGESMAAGGFGASGSLLHAISGAADVRRTSTVTLLATPDVNAGDMLVFRLTRDANAGDDDLSVDARLHSIEVTYPATQ